MRARIPGIEEFQVDEQELRDRDKEAKERGKLYAADKRSARESDMKEGDRVLLKQEKTNKLTPASRPKPFRVLEKTGKSVVVESAEGVQHKKYLSHVKKFFERDGLP